MAHLLEHVFNAIPDIIGIQNLQHKILYYNSAGYAFLGKKPEEVLGCECFRLIGRHSPCDNCAAAAVVTSGMQSRVTRYYDELNKWLDIRAYPVFDSQGNLTRIIEHIRDVSEEKRYQAELEKVRIKSDESDRLKASFLDNISHEIRTPLNAIIGFSDLLMSETFDRDKSLKFVEYIRSSGLGLLQMINDILDYSMLEAGELVPEVDFCDLDSMLEELAICFRDEIARQQKEIRLMVAPPPHAGHTMMRNDPNRIRQMLWNLLQNAVNFTKEGHIRLGYSLKEQGRVLLFVEDTGIGIPKKDHEKVFEKFYTASGTASSALKGSGIGLALVRSTAGLLSGQCYLVSSPGAGSTFYLNLPVHLTVPGQTTPRTSPKSAPAYDWHDKHILVAEDEELNFLFLQEALSVTHVRLTWARNGLEAVTFYKEHADETDLILMDLRMPGMDGFEATSRIRKFDKKIPVVGQSAYLISPERKSPVRSGFNDLLTKPIRPRVLLETLNRHLTKG